MDVGVGILFIAVLCADIVLLPLLGGRHVYLGHNATSGDIADSNIEQLDLDTMGITVGISFLPCA